MSSREPIFLEPVFQEKIWGGDRLRTSFGYDIPSGHTGECWAISGHPGGDCRIKGRPGQTLGGLWREERALFIRRYWYLDSIAHISQRFSLSESKVKTTLFRCRNQLRAYLEKEGYWI